MRDEGERREKEDMVETRAAILHTAVTHECACRLQRTEQVQEVASLSRQRRRECRRSA